jgi:thiamine-monophosphate kinase
LTMRIKEIGEFGLIDEIRKLILSGDGVVVGIGDDAAVLTSAREGMYDLLTTDMLVEGTHFDLSQATPYQLGWKALGCALSDIAAMAGVPRVAVASLGIRGETSVDFCRELYSGMNDVGGRFGCGIVGGDTVGSSRGLVISVAVLGEVEIASLTLRSGAEPGDELWVTGTLGGSLDGKHQSFMPRLKEAKFIVNRLRATLASESKAS